MHTEPTKMLMELLPQLKKLIHLMGQHVKFGGRKEYMITYLQTFWGSLHGVRIVHIETQSQTLYYDTLNKAEGQCEKIRKALLEDEVSNVRELTVEYMILRKYVLLLEQDLARQLHYDETKVTSKSMITIPEAAKLLNKSIITIRRYIRDQRIKSYQFRRQIWIPIEETEKIRG